MDTDYEKINLFDTSAVFVATIGMLLIGLIMFLSFPEKQQKNIASAFSILDMSQEVEQQQKNLLAIFEATDNVSNAFYQAFNEVAAMPDDILILQNQIQATFEKLGQYSEYMASGSQQQALVAQLNIQRGEILGAFIDNSMNAITQRDKNDNQAKIKNKEIRNNQITNTLILPDKQTFKKYLPNLLINY